MDSVASPRSCRGGTWGLCPTASLRVQRVQSHDSRLHMALLGSCVSIHRTREAHRTLIPAEYPADKILESLWAATCKWAGEPLPPLTPSTEFLIRDEPVCGITWEPGVRKTSVPVAENILHTLNTIFSLPLNRQKPKVFTLQLILVSNMQKNKHEVLMQEN